MKTSPRALYALIAVVLVLATASLFFVSQRINEQDPPTASACVNQCGNGTCEEMVCMAVGCPCAETVESCPQDCAKR